MALVSVNIDDAVFTDLISTYTGTSGDVISRDTPFADVGLDSITAVQLANDLFAKFKFVIHSDELFGISLGSLLEYIKRSRPTTIAIPSNSYSVIPLPVNEDLIRRCGTESAHLLQVLSTLVGVQAEHIEATQTLGELGIDSFQLEKLQNQLEESYPSEFRNIQLELNWTVQDLTDITGVAQTHLPGISRNNGPFRYHTVSSSSLSNPQNQAVCLQNPFVALANASHEFENAARKSGFHAYWDKVAPLQDDLMLAYVSEAFHALGVDLSAYPHGTEIPTVQHIPRYNRLMKRLWGFLESRYIVVQRAGKILRGSDSIDVDQASQLCQILRIQYPPFACEANLMALVGPKLADCLSGRTDAVSVLFGTRASLQIMEEFYAHAPMMSASTDQLVAFLLAVLQDGDYSHEHPIRILEVGAGTGGTTARLAEALAEAGFPVEYVFSDVGKAFVASSKARFGKRYPWMKFEVLNLEQEVPAAFHGRYDITLGINVVHATSDRVLTCRRLRETLLPGGIMVLSEVTREINWYDICFGLLDGWWLSEGGKGYPIQQADTWMDTFLRAGFSSMNFSTGPTKDQRSQQLLVACNRKWEGSLPL